MSRTLCILFDGKNQDFEFKVYIRLYRSLDTRYGAASKLNQVQFIECVQNALLLPVAEYGWAS